MEKVVLKATKRDVIGKQVKAMRREGKLPAVIYGRHLEPISIVLEAHTAGLALAKVSGKYPVLKRVSSKDMDVPVMALA